MAKDDVGSSDIEAAVGTQITLRLKSKFGAVIAVAYELALVASPPERVDQRQWNDLDFHKANPRLWQLPEELAPGRYLGTVVPVLMPPDTELEIALLDGNGVIYRRTASADEQFQDGIAVFSLTIS